MSVMTGTMITKDNGTRELPFDSKRLLNFIQRNTSEFNNLDIDAFQKKIITLIEAKEKYASESITNLLILESLANIDMSQPDWTYVASRIYLRQLYHEAAKNRAYDASQKYGSFYGLLKTLGSKGIYSSLILKEYTKDEIQQAGTYIVPDRDNLFTYIGLKTLAGRYLATDHDRKVYELPQERFLVIAMTLMVNEPKEHRLMLVEEAYWALSNLFMTVATPTLANAGKSYGQLSSCFIDTVDDSLQGIFHSNTDMANLSKNGGGIGVYLGKLRSRGSDIKGFKGVAGGVNISPLVS